jgi:hypothetical protein
VESVHCFGGELGMEEYIRARPDVFFTGADGSMRSNRAFCQLAGQYAVDMFIGSTLQVDGLANSSTVTRGRLSGFGGAPNMGHDPHGRRHATPAWLNMITEPDPMQRGKKLVVQMVETFQAGVKPTFVEQLDAVEVAKTSGMPLAPVMIYGDDVTHVLTEEVSPISTARRASKSGGRWSPPWPASPTSVWASTPDASPNCVAAAKWSIRKISVFAAAMRPAPARRRQRCRPGRMVRRSLQPTCQIPELVMKLLSQTHAEAQVEKLALIARDCLIDEARLSPKPGLVDSRGNGAHHDLSLDLMERSAHSLTPTFLQLARQSWLRPADIALRETVGRLGREGERQMMAATDGVNTHRGAIWALGLLVSASAMLSANASAQQIADTAALLARLPDSAAPKVFSKGLKATHRYRVPRVKKRSRRSRT